MPLIQDVPMLTVYRNGVINLNGEATRLMHQHHTDVDLLPPINGRKPWQLDRRAGGSSKLVGGGRNGSHLRFRAPYRAAELFREQPADITRIIFRITPGHQHLDMYTLAAELPVPATPATVQHNPAQEAA